MGATLSLAGMVGIGTLATARRNAAPMLSTAAPTAVNVWATASPSPCSRAAGALPRPRAEAGSGGSGFLRPENQLQTSKLPPVSQPPVSSAATQPKGSAPSASPSEALVKVQRGGSENAAKSSGAGGAGPSPLRGASNAGTRQSSTPLATPTRSTSPAAQSSSATRMAGRFQGVRTMPARTSLTEGLSSTRSARYSRLSTTASSRAGSRPAATHQASTRAGSSTFLRACVRRFVGPAEALACCASGAASAAPALSAASTALAYSAGKTMSSTPSPKLRPKRQSMTSSSSRPCRACPAMVMMTSPALRSGCPGSSETSSMR
mmetsp:Transcript_110118/g.355419  ORF Transcript_110118/g.355419 Transcript_110118/m.355419 type:complete len:320 (-) Transcript_110118:1336-2295(-)